MGGAASRAKAKKPVVLILGGGFGGVAAARALDVTGDFFVVLIDRKEYFLNNVGALRASLDTAVAKQVMVPYTRLLAHGVFLQADIEEVRPDEVRLQGRADGLRFDYLIIATGSSYAFPGKIAEPKLADAFARFEAFGQRVRQPNVKNIVLVGGGSVGIELAAEMKDYLPATTNVTIVHSNAKLIHNEPLREEFLAGVEKQLAAANVRLEKAQRVAYPDVANLPAHVEVAGHGGVFWNIGQVTTSTGKVLPADLLIFTAGARNNVRSLTKHFGHVMKDERLIVNAYMQVQDHARIFAVGDIAGTAVKRAMYAEQHAAVAAKNIIAMAAHAARHAPTASRSGLSAGAAVVPTAGSPSAAPAVPPLSPLPHSFAEYPGHCLVLTIGRNGMSQLYDRRETVLGAWPTWAIKSRGLFIAKYWSDLNQSAVYRAIQKATEAAGPPAHQPFDIDAKKHAAQIAEAARVLGGDQNDAKAVLAGGLPNVALHENQQFV